MGEVLENSEKHISKSGMEKATSVWRCTSEMLEGGRCSFRVSVKVLKAVLLVKVYSHKKKRKKN